MQCLEVLVVSGGDEPLAGNLKAGEGAGVRGTVGDKVACRT